MPPHLQFPPYAVLTALSALLALYLARYAWQRRNVAGAAQLALLMCAAGVWGLAYTFELLSADVPAQIFFTRMAYPGIVSAAPAWFLFARRYTGRASTPWGERYRWVLWIIPGITLALVATNEYHGLMWGEFHSYTYGAYTVSRGVYGPWFWFHAAYSYLLLAYGTWALWLMARTQYRIYRSQSLALMVGILPPWIANGIYLTGHEPLPGLDMTVIALLLSGAILTLGLYRYHLLDVIPVAAETVLETMQDGILVVNREEVVLSLNQAAARMLGIARQWAAGSRLRRLLPTLPPGPGPHAITLNGLRLNVKRTSIPKHAHLRLVYLQDVTALQEAADLLRAQNRFLERLNHLTRAILVSESEEEVLPLLARLSATLFRADQSFIVLASEHQTDIYPAGEATDPSLREAVLALTRQSLETEKPIMRPGIARGPFASALVLPLISDKIRLGALCLTWARSHPMDDALRQQGEQVASQISLALARLRLLREVRLLAVQDDLTGAYNHRYLNITGQHLFARARRYDEPLCVLMFDLDHFKAINDRYGHLNGDLLLRQVAQRSRQSIRKSDILVRYGGDEFVILLPNTTLKTATGIARRLHDAVTAFPVPLEGAAVTLAFSMGMAARDDSTPDLESLIRKADRALYHAKNTGRNRICTYAEITP